ncbi:MAG: glycosyltransferase [Ignavibacteriales bacterium]|nr:glycosyltransferase [Ignavibacteriales bacterium]
MLASAPWLEPERVTTIHNGIDVAKFERAAPLDFRSRGVPENARVVGFLGRLCEQKGVDVLIEAFARVAEKRADVVLALAGEGEMEALVRERARAGGVEERVLFLGFLDDPAPFLKAIDLFVLSSRWEGFGIVLAEAMAAGKPCVTTDAGSVVEIVEDKTTGLVVPPEDPDALARAMERLIDDGVLAKRMGDAGARRVREKFTVERMGDDYERLFYRIAKRPRVRVSAETLRPDVKKICIIKPRGIGDIVLSTILLDNLAAAFPDAEIHYFVEKFARDAVEDLPLVEKAITTKRKESSFAMAKKLRAERYDLIIDSWSNPRSAQAVFLSGARYRVGYAYRGRRYAYNLPVWHRRERKSHAAESNLPLLRFLDLPTISKRVHYNVPDRQLEEARRFIAKKFPNATTVAGVAPAGGWASKRCDKEKWAEFGAALVERLDASIVVVWGPGDEEDAEHIERALGDRATRIPKTTVKEMSAYLAACDVVLANDSGPMHIAAAVGVPTLGVFGPTNPEAHGPYSPVSGYVIKDDLDCIRCGKFDCPYDHECMRELPASVVVEKAIELLANARRSE